MKDRDTYLDMMIADYENSTGYPLSLHDPIFHAFNAVADVADILSIYADKEARERYLLTAKRRNSVVAHAIGMGYRPMLVEPDRHNVRITFSDAVPDSFVIHAGRKVRTTMEDDEFVIAEVIRDVTVPVGATEAIVEVEVGETTTILLGTAKGVPDESFPIDADTVYMDSLKLKVETILGTETWRKVDNFLQSEEGDPHFHVELGAKNFNDMMKPNDLMAYVRCGDGISGKVFPADAQVYAEFRSVDPNQDTLPIGVINEMEDPIMYATFLSNFEITKDKVLPEDIETLRRNAIYTKSIGETLVTKEDFERASILQSQNKIAKAYAEARILNGKNMYTIHVRPTPNQTLTVPFLVEVRDRMYVEYSRNLNDEYELVVAPTFNVTMGITLMFQEDTTALRKEAIKTEIIRIMKEQIYRLDLGQTFKIPVLWESIMTEVKSTMKELLHFQITTPPPVVPYNAEAVLLDAGITFTETV